MKLRSPFLAFTLLVLLGAQLAFGWGNATHVYFAKELGAKLGIFNMNEMYGALLPDCFNLTVLDGKQFLLTGAGQYLYGQTHDNAMPMWLAVHGSVQKSLAFGFMTHNQSWGADYTAHVKSFLSPSYVWPDDPMGGYAREKGFALMDKLLPALTQILLDAGVPPTDGDGNPVAGALAYGIAPELGHDLAETAVDLLVKRNLDRAVGLRMMLAAEARPSNAGELLAAAYANDFAPVAGMTTSEATAFMIAAERTYRETIKQYGMAFSLAEPRTIALLAEQTAPVAELYIETAIVMIGLPPFDVTVTAAQVSEFIQDAIAAVKPDYARELCRTLALVENQLRVHDIRAGYSLFALENGEASDESADLMETPASYALAQNTPNPFNPSTQIGFSLPAQAHVRLTVYNAIGQEIATLVNEERPAGSHVIRWDAMNMPSGAYFYRIEAGSFVQMKRMMLVK